MGLVELLIFFAFGAVLGILASLLIPNSKCDLLDNIWFGIISALLGGAVTAITVGYRSTRA